jgi:myo-inositol-1(or 4)-monophosphatase
LFRPHTLAAVDAVQAAMRLANDNAGTADVRAKAGRDVVTSADIEAEQVIRQVLARAPWLQVVGEEQGGQAPADGSAYWLVDPICGTRNYASGTPMYCVNVALVEQGAVAAAVVGDPSTRQVHVAERGRGAWSLGAGTLTRLQASEQSRVIIVEDGKAAGGRRTLAAEFTAALILADRWDFRSLGSTLSLAYLAAGRVSGYLAFWFDSAVHGAAGALLATEAGGTVSDIGGRPWTLESDSVLAAASAALHEQLLALLSAASAG